MVGTAKVGEVGHELLGRLVITPAVEESASTEGAAFQSLLQSWGGVLLPSLSPLKAERGYGTPCSPTPAAPYLIRAKARGLAPSAP